MYRTVSNRNTKTFEVQEEISNQYGGYIKVRGDAVTRPYCS